MGSVGRAPATRAWSTKNQGITGQGVSAAGVVLAQEFYDLESDKEPKAEDEHRHTPEAADWEAMRILADNRSVRGTTAARMAWDGDHRSCTQLDRHWSQLCGLGAGPQAGPNEPGGSNK
jgi:hypothetical protein